MRDCELIIKNTKAELLYRCIEVDGWYKSSWSSFVRLRDEMKMVKAARDKDKSLIIALEKELEQHRGGGQFES